MSTQPSGQTPNPFEEEVRTHLRNVVQQNDNILSILKGNKDNPYDKGLLGEVHEISKKVNQHDNFIKRVKWTVVGAVPTSGYGLFEIFRRFFS